MAKTTKANVVIPELWDEALQGVFAQASAFGGANLSKIGAAVARGDFPGGNGDIGDTIKVPYFGVIGDFAAISTDGDAITPSALSHSSESATVAHAGLAIEVSRWARSSAGADIYQEGARQLMISAERFMDRKLIDAAVATTLVKDVYSATSPRTLDYDLMVDGKLKFKDEQEDVVGLMVHSKVLGDLLKLKDGAGRPMLTPSMNDGDFARFLGLPVAVSDHLRPASGSAMSAVTSSGTSPPTITLSGTPLGQFDLVIDCVVGGALATWTLRFSTDGGNTWSATMASAASVPLTDTATDSLVGVNGATGITAAIAAGTANADNQYTASSVNKYTSLLVKRNALAFWYNRDALKLQTDRDILADTDIGAHHLYYAAHMYRRHRGGTTPGVCKLVHN
jgi:hypothetical protein